jgi:hypothetical protein
MHDYIIIGGGPTGLALAYSLSLEPKNSILLLEQSGQLGGNWNHEWVDDKYFSEHSPKVLFTTNAYFFNFLHLLNVSSDVKNIYGNYFTTQYKMYSRLLAKLKIIEMFYCVQVFLEYLWNPKSFNYFQSVEDWMKSKSFSKEGFHSIKVLCVTLANTPDKLCMGSLITSILDISGSSVIQLKRPLEWIQKVEYFLSSKNNVIMVKNCTVESIDEINKSVISSKHTKYHGKNIISCVPLRAFHRIIRNSTFGLQRNWFDSLSDFDYFVDKSTYHGIGVQLHFDKPMGTMNKKWCWSCFNEWSIIVTQKDVTNTVFSKDKSIKSVWSCVILDMTTKGKHVGKSANECNESELISEVIHQLSKEYGQHLKPLKTTIHSHLYKEHDKWMTPNSGYSNAIGTLPFQGKHISNVFSVGPHNISQVPLIDTAIESAVLFCNSKNIITPIDGSTKYSYLFMMCMIVMMWTLFYLVIKQLA